MASYAGAMRGQSARRWPRRSPWRLRARVGSATRAAAGATGQGESGPLQIAVVPKAVGFDFWEPGEDGRRLRRLEVQGTSRSSGTA